MNTLNKIGLLMLALAALALGGCTTLDSSQAKVSRMDKSGTGVIYGQVMHGWASSVKSICEKPTSAGDARCLNQDQYIATAVVPYSNGWTTNGVYVLVPKSEQVEAGDILKVQIKGSNPAYFQAVASRGDSADCYFKRGIPSGGGVVCDGWDYRTDLAD